MRVVICVFCIIAMSGSVSASGETTTQLVPPNGIVEITVGAVPINVNINADNVWYETGWLTSEFAMNCTAKDYADLSIYLNGQLVTEAKPIQLKFDVINTNTGIEVKVVNTKMHTTTVNYIRTVPKNLDLRINGTPEENGFYYFTANNYLCKIDQSGNFVFYAYRPGAYNFKPTVIGNQIYYTYSQQNDVKEGFDAGNMKASAHVMNQWYAEIDCIPYLLTNEGMPENHPLENHEFIMLDKGHYIITSYIVKCVYNIPKDVEGYSPFGSRVVAGVFQEEIKDGKLIFQWDSTEHPELYGMSVDSNDFSTKTSDKAFS